MPFKPKSNLELHPHLLDAIPNVTLGKSGTSVFIDPIRMDFARQHLHHCSTSRPSWLTHPHHHIISSSAVNNHSR
jgi:hypothetical protein